MLSAAVAIAAAVLWFGAHAVMAQELTVGMFVAFTMFANRVAQPVMRIAQLWTDFQQTGIFPINHAMVLRRSLFTRMAVPGRRSRNRWMPRSPLIGVSPGVRASW